MTGEELFIINDVVMLKIFGIGGMGKWIHQPPPKVSFWEELAHMVTVAITNEISSGSMTGHYPSTIPSIKPLPKDTDWNQFYKEDPGINIEKVKERILSGDNDMTILKWFVRLDYETLQKIKTVVNKKP